MRHYQPGFNIALKNFEPPLNIETGVKNIVWLRNIDSPLPSFSCAIGEWGIKYYVGEILNSTHMVYFSWDRKAQNIMAA